MKLLFALVLVAVSLQADSRNQVFEDFTIPLPLREGETLVLGIVGGWERWDAPQRIIRRVALRLRERSIGGVHVETVENHKIELAEELVTRAFPDPKKARLVIYGQSLGGSAAVRFSRWLNGRGYPVNTLVVIDSYGKGDETVPPNVKNAVNLYQDESWPINGERFIQAEDPLVTRVLGNYRFTYKNKTVDMENEPGIRRRWMKSHLKMEYDPEVWRLAESYLLQGIPQWTERPFVAAAPSSSTPIATTRRLR
jgi:hypothetical protein